MVYLGDIEGAISDHCNKANTAIKQVTLNFWLPSACYGEGNGTPLQYSCLENPMGGGAW